MKKYTVKRYSVMLTMACVWCFMFNIIASLAISVSADEYDLDAPYLDMEEVDHTCKFVMVDSEGNRISYVYSMMYEFDESDVLTFHDIMNSDGEGVTALHIRKYDTNGDGELSIADFLSIYRNVYGNQEGFYFENRHYPYQLVKPYLLEQYDIDMIKYCLAKLITKTGVDISNYDYNMNGDIDIGDLVMANKYRANNPIRWIETAYGTTMEPEDLVSLLEAADSFGVENFIIKPFTGEWIPYSILRIDDSFYSGKEYKEVAAKYHAMQILPNTDTVLYDYGFEPTYNWGDNMSFWRHRYDDDDNFEGDILWITRKSAALAYSSFMLIPLDEEGRRLGNLYPSAENAELAPEGVTF